MIESLPELDLSKPSTLEPGAEPVLEWVSVAQLRIDRRYQRPVTARGMKTIEKIVREFRWERFSPLIVARGDGKTLNIVDGQHRAAAAQVLDLKKVPASVIDATVEQQAAMFAAINGTVTPMTILQLFKAARLSGEDWALSVDRVCGKAGIEPLVYPVAWNFIKPFQMMAIGTLRARIARYGESRVAKALRTARGMPGAEMPGYWRSQAIDKAINDYREQLAQPDKMPAGKSTAARVRELHKRGFSRQAIAAATGIKYREIEEALS